MLEDDTDEDDGFIIAGKRAIMVSILIILGLVGYIIYEDLKDLHEDKKDNINAALQPQGTATAAAAQPAPVTHDVAVSFHVGGKVAEVYFVSGAMVKQGDLMATLDRSPFEAAVANARAQLQSARAQYDIPARVSTDAFNAVENAQAKVQDLQHTYEVAQAARMNRESKLVSGRTDNVYLNDVQDEQDAKFALERAQRELAQQQDVSGMNADRESKKVMVERAQAALSLAEANLADSRITAPASGVITSRTVEVGDEVSADTVIYTLSANP